MLNHWFLTANIPLALCTPYRHDGLLVAVSYLVATFSAYTAFDLIGRVRAASDWNARLPWLITAGLSMGFGIWAMHFIAILAVEIPTEMRFDLPITTLSAGFAAVAAGVAFHLVANDSSSRWRLALAGIVLGTGIGLMHYTGMAALRMAAHIYYDPWLFALSVVLAIVLSTTALVILSVLPRLKGRRLVLGRITGSAVMGLAIVLMHYTGMFATYFYPEASAQRDGSGASFDPSIMAAAIAFISLLIVGVALIAALFDRRVERAETLLRDAVNSISEGFVIFDQEDRLVMCNDAYRQLFRNSADKLVPGTRFADIVRAGVTNGEYAALPEPHEDWIAEQLRVHREANSAIEQQLSDGSWVLITDRRMRNGGTAGLRIDISALKAAQAERNAAEQRLVQAQKMETVGQLTGGLAHDFNNILGGIIGNLDMAAEEVAPDSDAAGFCKIALDAALSGAELVKRLLAFSRRQALHPSPTSLDAAIGNVLPLIKRVLGEHISIETQLASRLWPAVADPVQLESAILNLAVNARDAMPQGGELSIRAANVVIEAGNATAFGDLKPGEYVTIAVRDTGVGMSEEVRAHAFEPFFTTKPTGAGSGLGLSMVYGTMQQLGGAVYIDSAVGLGTTVRLYLPRAAFEQSVDHASGEASPLPTGQEHILLVEDNEQIRVLGRDILRSLGYDVTVAASGDEAIARIEQGERFDLLFTDVVMPGRLNGIALANELRAREPSARILFTSGYASPRTLGHQVEAIGAELIAKPYRKTELAVTVRSILNRPQEATA